MLSKASRPGFPNRQADVPEYSPPFLDHPPPLMPVALPASQLPQVSGTNSKVDSAAA